MEKRIFDESNESRLKRDFRSDLQYCDWLLRSVDSPYTTMHSRVNFYGRIAYNSIRTGYGILPVCTI